jgi:hypothetical protein
MLLAGQSASTTTVSLLDSFRKVKGERLVLRETRIIIGTPGGPDDTVRSENAQTERNTGAVKVPLSTTFGDGDVA